MATPFIGCFLLKRIFCFRQQFPSKAFVHGSRPLSEFIVTPNAIDGRQVRYFLDQYGSIDAALSASLARREIVFRAAQSLDGAPIRKSGRHRNAKSIAGSLSSKPATIFWLKLASARKRTFTIGFETRAL
jgi:hypothetical protein